MAVLDRPTDTEFVEALASAAEQAVRSSKRAIIADRRALQSVTVEIGLSASGQLTGAESWISRRIPISRQLGLAGR